MVSSQNKGAGSAKTELLDGEERDPTVQAERREQAKAPMCLSIWLSRQEKQVGVASAKEMRLEGKLQSPWEGLCMPSKDREDYVTSLAHLFKGCHPLF